MKKREFLSQFGLLVLGGAMSLVFRDIFFERDADRRFALYNIMRELRKGISWGEVESIINRHDAPFIRKDFKDQSIYLSVKLGGINMLYLALEFTTGLLSRAKFGGEDSPWDVPKDAPPNIE